MPPGTEAKGETQKLHSASVVLSAITLADLTEKDRQKLQKPQPFCLSKTTWLSPVSSRFLILLWVGACTKVSLLLSSPLGLGAEKGLSKGVM